MALITDILTRLNIELRDTDNVTFSVLEKTEALTRAIEEEVVAVIEEDASTVLVQGGRTYPLNSQVRNVLGIDIDTGNTGLPIPLDAEAYTFIAPNLTLASSYINGLPAGSVLYINWLRKLITTDDFPAVLVPYILNKGIYYTTEELASGKVNRFLRNDTSLAEIIQRGNMALKAANDLKKSLPTRRYVRV